LASAKPVQACGPIDNSYSYFNLFVPEWIFDEEYSPTFYTTNDFRHIWSRPDYSGKNLSRWRKFLGKDTPEALLEKVLYDRYAKGYESVSRAKLVQTVLFDGSLLPIKKQEAAKKYLLLSLELEALSARPADPWRRQEEAPMSAEAQQSLIQRLRRAHEREEFPYLKNRYAFQLLKAYRYSGQRDQAIAWYEEAFAEKAPQSMIEYWAMDHYAGMLLEAGKAAEGYYHFLRVFESCSSRRHSAYYSFDVGSEAVWKATYRLCQSPREKALMHFIRGTKREVLGLEDMQAIFSLLGNHQWLKMVTVRELNKLESENFHYFNEQPVASIMERLQESGSLLKNEAYQDYAGQLLRFAATAYYNNRSDGFWQTAKAYLEMMTGKLKTAELTLSEGNGMEQPYERIRRELNLALELMQAEEISQQRQDFIAHEIVEVFEDEQTRFYTQPNNQEFILDLLAYRMREQGKAVLADLLSRQVIRQTKMNPSAEAVDRLLALARQPEHTQLELLALKHFAGNEANWKSFLLTSPRQVKEIEYTLLDIKGRLLMRDPSQLEAAVALFDSLPPAYDFQLRHNPFNTQIKDCIHDPRCQLRTSAQYTRDSFVRQLLAIRHVAQTENSAMDYYLLGNAYYNMTYFGPAYYLMNFFRSGAAYDGFADCSVALRFYKKAMKLAENRELAAKACFMAAKAQQNQFFLKMEQEGGEWYGQYTIREWGDNPEQYERFQAKIKAQGYREYFKRLREEYAQTRFFDRAVKECKYLAYYLAQ